MAKFILSKSEVWNQYKKASELGEVWYNFKTNPEVGKILETKGVKLVTSSKQSLREINNYKNTTYIIQGDSKEQLKEIVNLGIESFVVDNENDLDRVLGVYDDIELMLRIKVREHTVYTGKYFVYGIPWQRAAELLNEINVKKLGVHFHRKTQNIGEWDLKKYFEMFVEKIGDKIDFFNIGGGLPVEYVNSKPNIDVIFGKIRAFGEYLKEQGLDLVLEPGRFLAAPAVRLETIVLNAYEKNLILDASIYNAAMDTYLFHVRLPVIGETESGFEYLLKGHSPDSLDIFRYRVFFPEEKKVGDKIVFKNAGAYSFHTDFADLPRVEYEIVDKF